MIAKHSWLLLAVMLVVSYCSSEGQDTNAYVGPADVSGLTLRLVSSKRTYSLREHLVLDASLRNVRSRPVFVYDCLGWGRGSGISLTIEDASGAEIKTLAMDDLPL